MGDAAVAPHAENCYIKSSKELNLVIAIDGPAASGKSTTAKLVARRLGYLHLDTGAMYRAITLQVLRQGLSADDGEKIADVARRVSVRLEKTGDGNRVLLDGEDVTEEIRSPRISRAVSAVSSHPEVRSVLVAQQRTLAAQGGVVLEGRDIGTVVLPRADLKIFMVADVAERAKRRRADLEKAGNPADEETIVRELTERDNKDSTRATSPLRKAEDAIELDTSQLTIEQQVEFIVQKAEELLRRRSKA